MRLDGAIRLVRLHEFRHLISGKRVKVYNDESDTLLNNTGNTRYVRLPRTRPVHNKESTRLRWIEDMAESLPLVWAQPRLSPNHAGACNGTLI